MCKPTITATYSIHYRGFTIRSYQFHGETRYRILTSRPIDRISVHGWDTTVRRCKDRIRVKLCSLGVSHLKELRRL